MRTMGNESVCVRWVRSSLAWSAMNGILEYM